MNLKFKSKLIKKKEITPGARFRRILNHATIVTIEDKNEKNQWGVRYSDGKICFWSQTHIRNYYMHL